MHLRLPSRIIILNIIYLNRKISLDFDPGATQLGIAQALLCAGYLLIYLGFTIPMKTNTE